MKLLDDKGIPRSKPTPSTTRVLDELSVNTAPRALDKGKGKDVKPTPTQLAVKQSLMRGGSINDPFVINDSEDDEVEQLLADQVPIEFRKTTNETDPIVLEDDDESTQPPVPLADIFLPRPAPVQEPSSSAARPGIAMVGPPTASHRVKTEHGSIPDAFPSTILGVKRVSRSLTTQLLWASLSLPILSHNR